MPANGILEGGLSMKTEKISALPAVPTPLGGRARTLVDQPALRLVSLLLEPDEAVQAHTAPVDVVFIIEEGSGRILAGEGSLAFQSGEIIVCPAGQGRAIQAGPSGARLLVARAPNL